ncbi:hypothetical protein [Rhizobium sp. AG855]|uniref:hypothetical protein n=1 Tax=Rhizobium sp. AG855 TaxID=2183898 RepID=UPI000E751196|nr:hypothetical protein [Rhizobium sp. AG855]RKE86334.1 hypothetical protein DFO46_3144 [Rhizobium sp. AG855]
MSSHRKRLIIATAALFVATVAQTAETKLGQGAINASIYKDGKLLAATPQLPQDPPTQSDTGAGTEAPAPLPIAPPGELRDSIDSGYEGG